MRQCRRRAALTLVLISAADGCPCGPLPPAGPGPAAAVAGPARENVTWELSEWRVTKVALKRPWRRLTGGPCTCWTRGLMGASVGGGGRGVGGRAQARLGGH
jgi:hypothetical protein